MCEDGPSPAAVSSTRPSINEAWRSVLSACSVSLLAGETAASTSVRASGAVKKGRSSCVRACLPPAGVLKLSPTDIARTPSLRAMREELIIADSFVLTAECLSVSMRCSEPARSISASEPKRGASSASPPLRTCTVHTACDLEDASCTPVAAVARNACAYRMSASSASADSTGTSSCGTTCTSPERSVISRASSPPLSISRGPEPASSV
mmetsp:Transcript_23401/g.58391  ORF Transcript_23401/g.58391 Transcript_23401/m.58391 type:complete len:209 (-) Transcript_23401:775-1401(-)